MGVTKQSLGVIGLVLLFFAAASYGLTREFDLFVGANLVFGLFALVSTLLSAREGLGTFLGERSTRYGANAALYSLLFVGVIVIVNFLAARHYKRVDVTQEKIFSLAPQSVAVIKGLEKELSILAFVEAGKDEVLEDLLKSYGDQSSQVKSEMVDPDKNPELAQKYNISNYNTVRIAYGDNSTLVTKLDEESITNGILRVTQATKKTVCMVEGHGEPALDDSESPRGYAALKTAFEGENFAVQSVLLASQEKVPADCSLLVVASAPKAWLEQEMEHLKKYLESGGRALFLLAAQKGEEFQPLLAAWGIELGKNVLVDQVLRLFQGPALGLDVIVATYGQHAITEGFKERTIYPMSRSVDVSNKEGVEAVSIAKTSPTSWAETNFADLFQPQGTAKLDPETDTKGPISVAAAAKRKMRDAEGKDVESRVVVFGSQDFANNKFLGAYFNRDLVLNAVNWSAGEEKSIAPIRARSIRSSRVQLTSAQARSIFYAVFIIPELLLLAGIAVWSRRRVA